LVVVSLVEDGILALETTARSLLGSDLPLVDDDVTVEQLLAHRSGIGDYLDEDAGAEITDYVMTRPVHELLGPEDYLPMLEGHRQKFPPGTSFSYCNGGYVVLALLAERASGSSYHEMVSTCVLEPSGMSDTKFLRSDELPGRAALGYLDRSGLRTNVLHLPVRGTGDGGLFTTAADVSSFWIALFDGRIVPGDRVAQMVMPRSDASDGQRYGLGFWLHGVGVVALEGYDAGVSFRTSHEPGSSTTCTVMSNWTNGAWDLARALEQQLFH
jgi:CubicO group peptidase (beta-lactamase class C family)